MVETLVSIQKSAQASEFYFFHQCRLDRALEMALKTRDLSLSAGAEDEFNRAIQLLIRIYTEKNDFESVNKLKAELHDLVITNKIQMTSRLYYQLGVSSHIALQLTTAMDYFQKAIVEAEKSGNVEDAAYAWIGRSNISRAQGYFDESRAAHARAEEYSKKLACDSSKNWQLPISISLFRVSLDLAQSDFTSAQRNLDEAMKIVRSENSLYFQIHALYLRATLFKRMGEQTKAQSYLEMILLMLDETQFVGITSQAKRDLQEMGTNQDAFDLTFSRKAKTIRERMRGLISLNNQFILVDLVHLFVSFQGEVLTKERIVQHLWSQDYDPRLHDNKLYVTIKRLRELIEPEDGSTKYIFRAKNGYYLDEKVRVHIET